MEHLILALVQSDLHWENIEKNLISFEEKIESIDFIYDMVILPEMFTTGFTMQAKKLGESMDGPTMKWIKHMAEKFGTVVTGSFIANENGKFFNRLIWMRPDGSFEYYDKKHLFRMAGEEEYYSAGKKNITVELKGWKIRPLICYDLRFPVWSRNRYRNNEGKAMAEYDVLLYVANWPAVRSLPWDILLRARAVENQAFCIGLNRVGIDGLDKTYNGHTTVIDPKGEYILGPVDENENIFRVELKYEDLQKFREKFPQGMDADNFKLAD